MSETLRDGKAGRAFKAKDLIAQAKQLGDKGPPLSSDEKHRLFYPGTKSTARVLFVPSGDKKWSKIRVLINGCIDTDFGPSCIAKIMDLPEKSDMEKIAETLGQKKMVFSIKLTNMGAPYAEAVTVRKEVIVLASRNGTYSFLFDDALIASEKGSWNVDIQVTREGTDPADTFEGTFSLEDIEVILPEVLYESEEAKKVAQIKEQEADVLKKQLAQMMTKLEQLEESVSEAQGWQGNQAPPIPPNLNASGGGMMTASSIQPSPATLAEVLKNCDMATLQKLKQLGVLQLDSKQAPILGDPLSPPAVIDAKPPGVPLGKMGGRKVDGA